MIQSALYYHSLGFSVIPLRPRGKKPELEEWKPYQTRRATKEQIETWWKQWPKANVGIITGAISGIIALDIDGSEGTQTLKDKNFYIPPTPTARTGNGGNHYIFKHPGFECRSFAGKAGQTILPKIDFRADGGYIVAAPSIHPSGNIYKWIIPLEDGLADAPEWLLNLIREQAKGNGQRLSAEDWEEDITEGRRNQELARRAGSLLRKMPPAEALTMLKAWNDKHCNPPLPDSEVESIVESISKINKSIVPTSLPYIRGTRDGRKLQVVALGELEEPMKMNFIIEDSIPENYLSMIFGDGGNCKSYIALNLACCVALGVPFLGKQTIQGNVLYCDFELEQKEQTRRAYKVARGLGLGKPPAGLFYFSPLDQENINSLNEAIAGLVDVVKDKDIQLTIIDSFGAAVAGDPESAKDVTALFRTLKPLGTIILLDHQAKTAGEKYRDKTAFGSVYKQNLARNVWQVQRVDNSSSDENQVKLALHHKKSNFGPLRDTIGLMATFGESFQLEQVELDSDFGEALTTGEEVLVALRELEEATADQVAEHLEISPKTVKNAITKLKRKKRIKDTGKTINRSHLYSIVPTSFYIRDGDGDGRANGDPVQAILEAFPGSEIVEGAPF